MLNLCKALPCPCSALAMPWPRLRAGGRAGELLLLTLGFARTASWGVV